MPRDIEHIVETHRLARQRVEAGLPVWDRRINLADVWRNEDLTFEQRRDAIVARLRRTWVKDRTDTLADLVDGLADTQDGDEFDGPWDLIYDYADAERVWIATF